MAWIGRILLKILQFLGIVGVNAAKSSFAAVVAVVTWVAAHISDRALAFIALRSVLLVMLVRVIAFFSRLVLGFHLPAVEALEQVWADTMSAGNLLPGVVVNTLNLRAILTCISDCFKVWLAGFAFRCVVYEFRFMAKFSGVSTFRK